jgi:hypothetical protein
VEANQRKQRRTGMAVLIALAGIVALAQIIGGKHHDDDGIDKGIHALAAAATAPQGERAEQLAKAERYFSASIGTVVVEPLAIVGLEVTEQMPAAVGTPDPETPAAATLDEKTAATYAQALLARGKPEAALAYLAQSDVRTRAGRGLAVIARFAERWVAGKAAGRSE